MDKASETSEGVSELLEFVAQEKDKESTGKFSPQACRRVEETGQSRESRPVSWLLSAVQLGNLWNADGLRFRCLKNAVQIELRGVGDREEWLKELLPPLREGRELEDLDGRLMLGMLRAGLSYPQGTWTLATSTKSEQLARAARIDLESTQWGEVALPPETLLLQMTFHAEGDSRFRARALRELHLFSCSDRVPVDCGQELGSFFPLSVRAWEHGELETELEVGLWALTSQNDAGIPLGRSFAQLKADGVRRRELSSGTFRVGLLGGKPAQESLKARSVVAYTYHGAPVPSRIVWLQEGVELAHQALRLEPQNLALTVYRELPEGWNEELYQNPNTWDSKRLQSSLDELRGDVQKSLEAMVGEYNRYTPSLDGATLGCWTFLILACLAGGGLVAPFLGSHLAAPLSALLALLLVRAEYQFRFKKRYHVGQGLKALAEELESKKEEMLWDEELLSPEERPPSEPS